MRVLEKRILQTGIVFRRLPLGARADDLECLLQSMRKHVQRDGSVRGLFVEYENVRVPVTHEREVFIIAQLATAYNQSLTSEQWALEKDLYGEPYVQEQSGLHCDAESSHASMPKHVPDAAGREVDGFCTKKTHRRTRVVRKRNTPMISAEWDAEKNGDRFIYDPLYEQNEEIVPWNLREHEEKFGWYM